MPATGMESTPRSAACRPAWMAGQVASFTTMSRPRTAASKAGAPPRTPVIPMLKNWKEMGAAGAFFHKIFGAFDFAGVTYRLPDETFSGETTIQVGDKPVHLIEVGPAHTQGDVIVHSPKDRAVFTGFYMFVWKLFFLEYLIVPVAWLLA